MIAPIDAIAVLLKAESREACPSGDAMNDPR
jgi:hypothetical protein